MEERKLTEDDFCQQAAKEFAVLLERAKADPNQFAKDYWKMLDIIANYYQFAGAHDEPEWALDLLADPEAATEDDVDRLQRRSNNQPKLVLALPDWEKRVIKVLDDEVVEGHRMVTVAIEG